MDGERSETAIHIIQTVAETTNTDPMGLPPLYETIDPEALQTTLEDGADGWVSFTYAGVEVTATCDGGVTVDEDSGSESR